MFRVRNRVRVRIRRNGAEPFVYFIGLNQAAADHKCRYWGCLAILPSPKNPTNTILADIVLWCA